jgi:hypothetical protein
LYFQTPLQGDFELRCQRTTFGWREIHPLYAGRGIELGSDKKSLRRLEIGAAPTTILLPEKVDWGQWVDYRMIVKDSKLSIVVNGKQLHSEPLPAIVDPWLSFRSYDQRNAGAVKDVQILGTPTVPREIQLSAAVDLSGWRAEYYGQTLGPDWADWRKKDGEIVARLTANARGSFREGLLQYHRPLLEDGELEYEFFYEPGKTEVHPALGRLAFLLEPAGAKLHWLTDAQYDRTGLASDNSSPLPASQPLPLNPGQWNKLRLALQGDAVTLSLNGQQVLTHRLQPDNQRTFGLFHYRDATAVRVRNVIHRGNWPTALPPLAEQELALPRPSSAREAAR